VIGTRIAERYVLESVLGAGRGGRVFAAVDVRSGRRVAVKLLIRSTSDEPDLERGGLRSMQHPHLVRVLDAGVHAGQDFVVTELAAGGSLAAVDKPLSPEALLALASQMLDGLATLHAHGVLHGDIKTENVFVRSLQPPHFELGDFGLAHRTAAGDPTTRGAPAFMAPEIVRGEAPDERSDLYALGVTLYECCFGELPFSGANVREVLMRQLDETPARLARPGPTPPRLVALLRALLAKEPAARPRDARQALLLWRGEAEAVPRWVPPHLGMVVGREAELRALEASLHGDPAAASVDGPSGTGKTRLLRELALRAELRGTRTLWWTPLDVESGPPFAEPEGAAAGAADTRRLAESRARRMRARLGAGPWLLLVDDLHLAPGWFRDTLAFFVRDAVGSPVPGCLVALAGRGEARALLQEGLDAGGLARQPGLALGPWSEPDLETAVSALLGARRVHADLLHLVRQASGGVPSEVEAVCQRLAAAGLLRLDAHAALTVAAEVGPAAVVAAPSERITAGLAACTDPDRALLDCFAILRAPAPEALVRRLEQATGGDAAGLQRAGLLQARAAADRDPLLELAHEGIRSAVLRELPAASRRALHDRLAGLLESAADLAPGERAVLHRVRGSDLSAARSALAALRHDADLAAHPELRREALESVLDLWPPGFDLPAQHRLELELQGALRDLGAYDEAAARAEALLASSPDPRWAAELRNGLADTLLARGDALRALQVLEDAGAGDARAGLERATLQAQALYRLGRLEEAQAGCAALAPRLEVRDPLADRIHDVHVLVLRELGRFEAARQQLQASIAAHDAGGAQRPLAADLTHLGLVEFGQGDMAAADRCFARAQALYQRAGDRFGMARTTNCRGAVAAETGRFLEARELFRSGLDLCRRLGDTENANHLLVNLAQLSCTLGRYDEALEHARQGLELAERRSTSTHRVRTRIVHAGILAVLGLDAACRAELQAVESETDVDLYHAQALLIASDLSLRQGDVDPVAGRLQRAERILSARSAEDERVVLDLLAARLAWAHGERAAARARFETALASARRLRLPAHESETEAWLAELGQAEARPDTAASAAEGLARARHLGLRDLIWRFERVLGLEAARRGDRAQALAHYEACVTTLRELCTGLDVAAADACLQHPARLRVFAELRHLRRGPVG
jgi:tetratricopeptide (TPR) repeat protein